jgi:hypothetical protein
MSLILKNSQISFIISVLLLIIVIIILLLLLLLYCGINSGPGAYWTSTFITLVVLPALLGLVIFQIGS